MVSSFGSLQQVGVQAVIKDLARYLTGAKQIQGANLAMAGSAQTAATSTTAAAARSTRAIGGLGTAFASIGGFAGAGIAAVGLLGVASAKAAIEFESAFAGVRKTVDATEEEFGVLEKGIRKLATTIPAGTTEISRVAEAAGQLGIQKGAILEFTRTMIDLGNTTNLSSLEAAEALARLSNIIQLPVDQYDNLGAAVVDLGNKSAATEGEIVDFGLRIAAAGAIAGLGAADILSIGTAMASVGIQSESGGTAVQKVLIGITQAAAEGGAELEIFAATAGLTAAEFTNLTKSNPVEAFVRFVEGLGAAGDDAFTILESLNLADQRLIRSFLSLANAGDLLRVSVETGNKAFEDNTALTTEAEKRYATTAAQLQILKNNFAELAIVAGQLLLPIINAITGALIQVAKAAATAADFIGDVLGAGVNIPGLGNVTVGQVLGGALKSAIPGGELIPGGGGSKPSTGGATSEVSQLEQVLDKLGFTASGTSGDATELANELLGVGSAAEQAADKTRNELNKTLNQPTQEQAGLQLAIARLNLTIAQEAGALESQRAAVEANTAAQLRGIDTQLRAIEKQERAISVQEKAIDASQRAADKRFDAEEQAIRDRFRKPGDAPTAEERALAELEKKRQRSAAAAEARRAALETQRAALEAQRLKIEEQRRAVQEESQRALAALQQSAAQAQLEAAQRQLDILNAQTDVLKAEGGAAEVLLTQEEQAAKARELIDALSIQTQETAVAAVASADLAREAAAAAQAAFDLAREQLLAGDAVSAFRAKLDGFELPKFPTPDPIEGKAAGGFITRPQIVRVGEGFKPELIVPLSRPSRARELLANLPAGFMAQLQGVSQAPGPQVTVQTGPVYINDPRATTGAVGDVAFSVQRALMQRGILKG